MTVGKNRRIIGLYEGQTDGPVFICTAGIHGNEHAGIIGLERIFEYLNRVRPAMNGTFIGVKGNMEAIRLKKRFIDTDLNRLFKQENIVEIREGKRHELKTEEAKQQYDLLKLFEVRFKERIQGRKLYTLDLHTTSAKGGVFVLTNDRPESVDVAKALGVSVITGLEKVIVGTTLDYFRELKSVGIGLEAGQHDDPESADNVVAAIWVLLNKIGCIDALDIPNLKQYKAQLNKLRGDAPLVVDFVYRHHVNEDDEFEMNLGYQNFQPVKKGEVLAQDKNGAILCPADGLILMPLYQKQGEDGFFIVEMVEQPQIDEPELHIISK